MRILLRRFLIGVLAVAGFGAAMAAQLTLPGYEEERPAVTRPRDPDPDSDLADVRRNLWSATRPPRSASTRVQVTLGSNGPDRVTATHTITLRADDPIAEAITTRDQVDPWIVWVRELVTRNPGLGVGLSYSAPVVTWIKGSSEITIEFRGDAEDEGRGIEGVAFDPLAYPDESGTPLVLHPLTAQSLRVDVAGGTVTAVTGRRPDEQGRSFVSFSGGPFQEDTSIELGRSLPEAEAEDYGEGEDSWFDDPRALWPAATVLPWLLVLMYTWRGGSRLRAPRLLAGGLIVLIPLLGACLLAGGWFEVAAVYVIFLLCPLAAAAVVRAASGRPVWSRASSVVLGVLGVLLMAITWGRAVNQDTPSPWWWAALLGGLLLAATLACLVLGQRRHLGHLLCLVWYVFAGSALLMAIFDGRMRTSVIALPLGLLTLPFALAAASLLPSRTARLGGAVVAAVYASTALLIPQVAIYEWPIVSDSVNGVGLGMSLVQALLPLLLVGLICYLQAVGRTGHVLGDRPVRGLVIGVAVLALTAPQWGNWSAITTAVAAWVMFAWLLPKARAGVAARLAAVSPAVHARLLPSELRHRVLDAAGAEYIRVARGKLAEGELSPGDFTAEAATFYRGSPPPRPGFVTARQAGFTSGGGSTPAENGRAALVFGLPAGLPFAVYTLWTSENALDEATTSYLVAVLLWSLMPAVCAYIYGYSYPLLRGDGPVAKALALFVALIPVELGLLMHQIGDLDSLLSSGIRLGQLLVICLSLGLFWERRLTRAAGLPWSMARDFRRFASVITPAVTVLVAAATAAGTALAGAAISSLLEKPVPNPAATEPPGAVVSPAPRRP